MRDVNNKQLWQASNYTKLGPLLILAKNEHGFAKWEPRVVVDAIV